MKYAFRYSYGSYESHYFHILGPISSEIGNCTTLVQLKLNDNKFQGKYSNGLLKIVFVVKVTIFFSNRPNSS
jgi:hypothetical protein